MRTHAMQNERSRERSTIESELLASIPRGETEQLRVTLDRAHGEGRAVAWISIRVWWRRADGEWCPSRKGITVRRSELDAVLGALRDVAARRDARREDRR
jgi:hypothetical protein